MKYRLSVTAMFAVSLLFLSHALVFSKTCIDFSQGTMLNAMLHSMAPVHTIINDGDNLRIEKQGSYHILGNIEGSIVVDSNKVIIDLNGFTFSGGMDPLITVTEGVECVIIKNGGIRGDCTNVGILLRPGVKKVILQDLYISDCLIGIQLLGNEDDKVSCCRVMDCHIASCGTGVDMIDANSCIFKNCDVCSCERDGFVLLLCNYNKFEQCKAIGIGSPNVTESVSGFVSDSGVDNLFYECFVENICKGIGSDFCTKAVGFWFYPSEQESKIINCVVDSITTASWGNAYGILLETELKDLSEITGNSYLFDAAGDKINDVDWSPQGDYVALAVSDGTVKIIKFDGITWKKVEEISNYDSESTIQIVSGDVDDFDHIGPRQVLTVNWSPDGRKLAVGTSMNFNLTHNVTFGCDEFGSCEATWTLQVSPGDKELFVYEFDQCLNKLNLIDSKDVGGSVPTLSLLGTWTFPSETGAWDLTVKPQVLDTGIVGDDISRVVWSNDCNNLYVLTKGVDVIRTLSVYVEDPSSEEIEACPACDAADVPFYQLYNFELNQNSRVFAFKLDENLQVSPLNQIENIDLGVSFNSSRILAISPDDTFLAYGIKQEGEDDIVLVAKTFCNSAIDHAHAQSLQATFTLKNVNDIDWNPIACCGTYYLALVGDVGEINGITANIEIVAYDGQETFTSIVTTQFDSSLNSVKWSPRGTEFVVTGTGANNLVGIFSFNPQTQTVEEIAQYEAESICNNPDEGGDPCASEKYVDWSPCGGQIIIVGKAFDSEEPKNVEIIDVGDSTKKCVVEGCRVANVCGGLCGIGISGAGCMNLIDKNLVCCSGVKYSQGVYARYLGGLLGYPGWLDNLPGNDCCSCCACECRQPNCVFACSAQEVIPSIFEDPCCWTCFGSDIFL